MTHLLDLDHWQEIRVALTRNRTRTALTAFGVFWGIFLLMVMLGSGSGLKKGVLQGFSDGATNSFFIWTQRTQKPFAGMPAGRGIRMTNADVAAIREKVPEAEVVAPRNQLRGFGGGNNVSRGRKTGAFSVMGDYPEIRKIQSLKIEKGRFLNPIDVEESRKVAVIGTRVRELLFTRGEEPIGESIVVAGVYFQVVGVFASPQTGDAAERDAQTLFVPFTTFQRAFNYGNRVGWMAIISRPDVPASVAEEGPRPPPLAPQGGPGRPPRVRAFQPRGGVHEDPGPLLGNPDPRLDRRRRDARRRRHRRLEHHAHHRQGADEGDRYPAGARSEALGRRQPDRLRVRHPDLPRRLPRPRRRDRPRRRHRQAPPAGRPGCSSTPTSASGEALRRSRSSSRRASSRASPPRSAPSPSAPPSP
ncbi:MAG: ABC transporter permease [Holophagales bacterium]|nr:ABC transporter permease [Holophagales bacterium]